MCGDLVQRLCWWMSPSLSSKTMGEEDKKTHIYSTKGEFSIVNFLQECVNPFVTLDWGEIG